VIPLPFFLVNDKNRTKIVNTETEVMKTRPSQQKNKFITVAFDKFFCDRFVLNKNAFRMLFYCYVVLPGHLSQHVKAATAGGLTFSDPIHKKVREI
jgi:hypothetical protein